MGYQKLDLWITKRQTGLSDVQEASLKYYIDYMTSINHSLSFAAAKAFAYEQLLKIVTAQTGLTRRQILVIIGSGT